MKKSDVKPGMHLQTRSGVPIVVLEGPDTYSYASCRIYDRWGSRVQKMSVHHLYPADELAEKTIRERERDRRMNEKVSANRHAVEEEAESILNRLKIRHSEFRYLSMPLKGKKKPSSLSSLTTRLRARQALSVRVAWTDLERLIRAAEGR